MIQVCLNDENGNTICKTILFAIDSYSIDLKSTINILFYSKRLLELNKKLQRRFIEDINEVMEIRGWYFKYFLDNKNLPKEKSKAEDKMKVVESELIEIYKRISVKYGLEIEVIDKNNV